jgi:hypothetical protein
MRSALLSGSAALALLLAGCTGNSISQPTLGGIPQPTGGINSSGLSLLTTMAIPAWTAGTSVTYDISNVDPTVHNLYLSDRFSKAVDIFNTTSLTLTAQVPGFTGQSAAGNSHSGPNGVYPDPGTPYVFAGDVNAIKVVNYQTASIAKVIPNGTTGVRTDEGCFDPVDGIVAFTTPEASPPYMTFVNAASQTIIATLSFPNAQGLEDCSYDPAQGVFIFSSDGTLANGNPGGANPHGELEIVTAASVLAGAPAIAQSYAEGNCYPAGGALGENEECAQTCDPVGGGAPTGTPVVTLIFNAKTGVIMTTITQVGGADEMAYDPKFHRFYSASRNQTSTGVVGGTVTPVLGIINADTLTWIANIPTGAGVHSVAVDSNNGNVFVPIPPTTTTAGGEGVYGPSTSTASAHRAHM